MKAEIWSAPNTEKIMQKNSYELSQYGGASISIQAFKNEYESAQLILTASGDMNSYDLKVSDLVSNDGVVLAKDNFAVYHQKYIEVTKQTTAHLPAGWYPDALLPIETAIEYNENKIKAGENQGIWITLCVPAEQKAGVYTGTFILEVDGTKQNIPVNVEIWDVSVPEENNLRSAFSIHRYWGDYSGIVTAELDASWEMYEAYYNFLKEFRINGRYLPVSPSDISGYVDYMLKVADDQLVTTYVIPYKALGSEIDYQQYKATLELMAEKSISNGKNLFKKAITYFSLFDEASFNGTVTIANTILSKVKVVHNELAESLIVRKNNGEQGITTELIESIKNVTHLYVDHYNDEMTADNAVYCPYVSRYNTTEERNNYLNYNKGERWWYTCFNPKTPFPTYHIDDYLYSSRIMSWMQYYYGVTGNLYWSATYFRTGDEGLDDYYSNALRFEDPNAANGDGFLLYPGKPYGIYGPVGSIRLHSIRDGMEEYEIIKYIGDEYAAISEANGFSSDFMSVYELLCEKLFVGTRVYTDTATFSEIRQSLASLATVMEKTGAIISSSTRKGDSLSFELFAPNGTELYKDGELLKYTKSVGDGKLYTVTMQLDQTTNNLRLSARKNQNSYDFQIDLGGKNTVSDSSQLKNGCVVETGDCMALVDGSIMGTENEVLQVKFAAKEAGLQKITYISDSVKQVNAKNAKLYFNIFNETSENIKMTVYVRGDRDNAVLYEVGTEHLLPGNNSIRLILFNLNWNMIGNIESIEFTFGDDGDNIGRTVYFDSLIFIER